jgi:hypothetical protein
METWAWIVSRHFAGHVCVARCIPFKNPVATNCVSNIQNAKDFLIF